MSHRPCRVRAFIPDLRMNVNRVCISPDQVRCGRSFAVDLNSRGACGFVEAFAKNGLRIESLNQISTTIKKILEMQGAVTIPPGCARLKQL